MPLPACARSMTGGSSSIWSSSLGPTRTPTRQGCPRFSPIFAVLRPPTPRTVTEPAVPEQPHPPRRPRPRTRHGTSWPPAVCEGPRARSVHHVLRRSHRGSSDSGARNQQAAPVPPIAGGAPTLDELRNRVTEIRARLQEIDSNAQGRGLDDDEKREWNELSQELVTSEDAIEEGTKRQDWITQISERADAREQGAHFGVAPPRSQAGREDLWDLTTIRSNFASPEEMIRETQDRAHRAIETFTFP